MDDNIAYYKWAKKIVDKSDSKGLDYYRKETGYYVLEQKGNAGVVAFKFILNKPKPHYVDFCNAKEVGLIEKKTS